MATDSPGHPTFDLGMQDLTFAYSIKRRFLAVRLELQWPSPLNDSDQHHDDGNHQQNVDEPPNGVAADESEQPQNQKNHKDRPNHFRLLSGEQCRLILESNIETKLIETSSIKGSVPATI